MAKRKEGSVDSKTLYQRARTDFLNQYKLEKGCECPSCKWQGSFIAEQLHLDHIDPATKNPRLCCQPGKKHKTKMRDLTWDDLFKELLKCQVLCGNCHTLRTVQEGHCLIE